jgi:hypothetical protein
MCHWLKLIWKIITEVYAFPGLIWTIYLEQPLGGGGLFYDVFSVSIIHRRMVERVIKDELEYVLNEAGVA